MNEFYPLNRIFVFKREDYAPVSMFFRSNEWDTAELYATMMEIAETSVRYYIFYLMMQKSQVLHHSENGGNPGASMMHNSDAQSEHDLRLRARLIQRAGTGEAPSPARRGRQTRSEQVRT